MSTPPRLYSTTVAPSSESCEESHRAAPTGATSKLPLSVALRRVLRDVLRGVRHQSTLLLSAVLVIALSLTLLGSALLLRSGVDKVAGYWKSGVSMSIYLKPVATQAEIRTVGAKLSQDRLVASTTFVDHEAAYIAAKSLFAGQPALLATVTPQDLPTSYRVTLHDAKNVPVESRRYATQPGVEQVAYPSQAIKSLLRVSATANTALSITALILLLCSIALVFSTIRTTVFARREEMFVMHSVGASARRIKAPFVLEGALEGVLGGLLASAALAVVTHMLGSSLSHVGAQHAGSIFSLGTYVFVSSIVVLVGLLAGSFGSLLAIRKYVSTDSFSAF